MSTEYEVAYQEAWSLLRQMRHPERAPSFASDAARAGRLFRRCLEIDPESWACMWGLGKVEQALRKHSDALSWFEMAAKHEPRNPNVWREACLEALALGEPQKALEHGQRAVDCAPQDAGIRANLALALLMLGRDEEAAMAAESACRQDPSDAVSRNVLELVGRVSRGESERPTKVTRR